MGEKIISIFPINKCKNELLFDLLDLVVTEKKEK
jgi:hypothetical protein